ncbi:MAG: HD domain-containing protein [Lachnospiraceae bacterium]|nr:HD domain-containing protein [Lachnospiraceae bacterium]
MRYIETLKEGMNVQDIYLCKQRRCALVTKNGKQYDDIILQDKTGVINGKIWEPYSGGIDECDDLDYVEVSGKVTEFNGSLQIRVERLRKVHEGEYVPSDYIPMSEYDIEEMFGKVLKLVESVKNPYLNALLKHFFVEDEKMVKAYKHQSAAKSIHHGFVGGLLEHSLSVAVSCNYIAEHYKFLNRDLLITAALLHDIGKTREFSAFPLNDYTDEGNLLGHIVMGSEMVGEAAKDIEGFPEALLNELKHCILSHHGKLEFGSPKKPALVEAVALNFADDMDAKLEYYKELMNAPVTESGEWMGYNRFFETNVRRTTEK